MFLISAMAFLAVSKSLTTSSVSPSSERMTRNSFFKLSYFMVCSKVMEAMEASSQTARVL